MPVHTDFPPVQRGGSPGQGSSGSVHGVGVRVGVAVGVMVAVGVIVAVGVTVGVDVIVGVVVMVGVDVTVGVVVAVEVTVGVRVSVGVGVIVAVGVGVPVGVGGGQATMRWKYLYSFVQTEQEHVCSSHLSIAPAVQVRGIEPQPPNENPGGGVLHSVAVWQ